MLYESPVEPPKGDSKDAGSSPDKIRYYTAEQRLHRLPGTRYSILLLDSNDAIFEKARLDFEDLLKSVKLD